MYKFETIAKSKLSKFKNIVVSQYKGRGFTVAQEIKKRECEEYGFMAGAFHIESVEGLIAIRDCLNEAIKKIEEKECEKELNWF